MAITFKDIEKIKGLTEHFELVKGRIDIIESFGGGRINKTYKITIRGEDGKRYEYLLQRVNNYVFEDTKGLMNNIVSATNFVRENGGQSLEYIRCHQNSEAEEKNGMYIYVDAEKNTWRMYHYIDADVYPCIFNPHHAYMLGEAIAEFSGSLDGFDATKLVETIPDFHNTPKRFLALLHSIARAVVAGSDRCQTASDAIGFVLEREEKLSVLTSALEKGDILCRVVHNDPKLNNVLFAKDTGKPICMIDLDTIMPGTCLYDVGDALRSICNTASEDDKTTENVSFSVEIFEEFVKGYLAGMKGKLVEKEIELIPYSVWVLAMELGIRFLKDHVDGDVYFGTEYAGQNLERANVQFALAKCIEEKLESNELQEIVAKLK